MSSRRELIPPEILLTAKHNEIKMIEDRVIKRKEQFMQCIMNSVRQFDPKYLQTFTFDLTPRELSVNSTKITNELSKWNGGEGYKNAITNYKQGHAKVRTYWNRRKPIPLGDYLFSTILDSLFRYIMIEFMCFDILLTPQNRLLLFIHIFLKLLHETIQFPKSMRRPLIMHSCFVKQNQFKRFCVEFIQLFECLDFKWNNQAKITKTIHDSNGKTKSQYVRNENRAQQLHDGFVDVLNNIYKKVQSVEIIPKNITDAIETFTKSRDENNNYTYSCVVVGKTYEVTESVNLYGNEPTYESSLHGDNNQLFPPSIDYTMSQTDGGYSPMYQYGYIGFHEGSIGSTEWARYSPMYQYDNDECFMGYNW
eukprot:41131_1